MNALPPLASEVDASTPASSPADQSPPPWRPAPASFLSYVVALTVVLGGITAILAAWQLPPFATAVVKTDNAYVRAYTTVISSQVSGYISNIAASDYQNVVPGQELLKIDDRLYKAQVAEAQANLDQALANLANNKQTIAQRVSDVLSMDAKIASAKAQLGKTTADLRRAAQLAAQGSGSISSEDSARAAQDTATAALQEAFAGRESAVQAKAAAEVNEKALEASVESARAHLQMAEINLGYTTVVAPEGGRLSDVGARKGQYVVSGTQLLFLVPPVRWVIANFKEAQTAAIRPGQRAWFFADALAGARFEGTVEDVSPAAGSEFSVLRTDNAIGNFTKIPQRISVKIKINAHQGVERLGPGMSVEAFVDTGSAAVRQ
ncbi:HlyD family secretion protein [Rhizobium gallicum]|uniref:HlyD family secretion protein n=1 Tax=Rhizobium gallicum TaxID=56730 RepID=UPI001EF96B39|nr:HlyD family secretion protein [Rhizobium gallicum]ULJ75777.1 HlyD family secretion protein [Rhizobium gallicum]